MCRVINQRTDFISDCINRKIDVAIVVDNSESVHDGSSDLQILTSFVANLIGGSDVDTGNVRFALSVYTHDVFNDFLLNTYPLKQNMLNHINMLPLRQGGTNTGGAIANLNEIVFKAVNGDRPNAPNVAVIITDGRSNNNTYTVQQANLAKSLGIHMIAVGVGLIDTSELHQIASEPTTVNVFNVAHFNGLFSIEGYIRGLFVQNCTGKC